MERDFLLTVVLEEIAGNENWSYLHQSLLMLFDSPLNHAGLLEIYIRLKDTRLIKLHREVRIPRTFKRFDQLFCNFLDGCDMPLVQTKDGQVRLLQFTNKSLDKVISSNYKRIRLSNLAPNLKEARYFASLTETSKRLVVFIEFGPVNFNILGEGRETEYEVKTIVKKNPDKVETFSISRYPLSSSLTCVKLTTAFERALEVF